jgi:hypothetical protein
MSKKQAVSPTALSRGGCILGVALLLISWSTASFALGTADERAACTPDVFRLCSSEIPNVDRIIACMKAKKTSLSPACKLVFDKKAPQQSARNPE